MSSLLLASVESWLGGVAKWGPVGRAEIANPGIHARSTNVQGMLRRAGAFKAARDAFRTNVVGAEIATPKDPPSARRLPKFEGGTHGNKRTRFARHRKSRGAKESARSTGRPKWPCALEKAARSPKSSERASSDAPSAFCTTAKGAAVETNLEARGAPRFPKS